MLAEAARPHSRKTNNGLAASRFLGLLFHRSTSAHSSNTGKCTLLGVNSARRGNAGAGGQRHALRLQALFHRRQEQKDIVGAAAVTHQADTPGFALELSHSAADPDAE